MKFVRSEETLIADRIRMKRRELGMSLTELHKVSGLPFVVCCDVENKERSLTNYELERIAKALIVNAKWLKTGR